MRQLGTACLLWLVALGTALAGPAEKAAQALFEGKLQPADAARVWAKRRLSPDAAVEMLAGAFPYEAGPGKDHVTTLRDDAGRETEARVGLPPDGPAPDGRYGVVILLHGLGGNSAQVFPLGRTLAPPHCIVIAPSAQKSPPAEAYEDLRMAALAKLPITERFPHWWSYQPDAFPLRALDYLVSRYRIDTDRVLLLGYSMGGFGTWNIGLRYHDRFAGLVPLAGGISRQEFMLGKDALCRDLLDNARGLPTFFAHGDADTVVPVKFDRWTAEGLRERGLPFDYEEVPGGGHVLTAVLRGTLQERLVPWLRERARDAHPAVIEHRALRPYHPGAYWVRLGDLTAPSARVLARCLEGNQVELTAEGTRSVTVYVDPQRLDPKQPVVVTLNGARAHDGRVEPSLLTVAESFARTRDPRLVYARAVTVELKAR